METRLKSKWEKLKVMGCKQYIKSMRIPLSIIIIIIAVILAMSKINYDMRLVTTYYFLGYLIIIIIIAPFLSYLIARSIWYVFERLFNN